jgi:hypothetical protein
MTAPKLIQCQDIFTTGRYLHIERTNRNAGEDHGAELTGGTFTASEDFLFTVPSGSYSVCLTEQFACP